MLGVNTFIVLPNHQKPLQKGGVCVLQSPNVCRETLSDINRKMCPSCPFREQTGKGIEHDSQSHDDTTEHKSPEALR